MRISQRGNLGSSNYLPKALLYKEIADQLALSIDTVRTHLRKVYEKLHLHSRTEAVVSTWANSAKWPAPTHGLLSPKYVRDTDNTRP